MRESGIERESGGVAPGRPHVRTLPAAVAAMRPKSSAGRSRPGSVCRPQSRCAIPTVSLGPDEIVPDRPFTALDLYESDLAVLGGMIDELRGLLTEAAAGVRTITPYKHLAWREGGFAHRLVVCKQERLLGPKMVCAVGFFAEPISDVDIRPLERANVKVVGEFDQYPGILSYSSVELPRRHWGNLVLHDEPEVADRWRAGQVHAKAVDELSSVHYRNVRIHNARLPEGLYGDAPLGIEKTKYFDYASDDGWTAVRDLATPLTG